MAWRRLGEMPLSGPELISHSTYCNIWIRHNSRNALFTVFHSDHSISLLVMKSSVLAPNGPARNPIPTKQNEAYFLTWWRHQMETFSALLALCAGNSPVPGELPSQRPVTWSFDVFFDQRLNKCLSKQSWDWCLRRHRAHYDVINEFHWTD